MKNKNYWLVVLGLCATVVGYVAAGSPKEKTVRATDLGSPVISVLDKNGKEHTIAVRDLIFQIRSDGLVGWRLSDEMQKQMEEEEAQGLKLPAPDYKSGRR